MLELPGCGITGEALEKAKEKFKEAMLAVQAGLDGG